MSVRPTISAALITLDEEKNLRELLPLLADWVDETVVIDGGSRDATVEVARSFGCRVVSQPFDSFARQRNRALALASRDWVFSIDADERPTPALVDEIGWRLSCARVNAFRVPIRSTIFGRPLRRSGTQDDLPVRLVRRGAASWEGRVHERLRIDGRVGRMRYWLTHQTQSTLDEFLAKTHRYTSLDARRRVEAGVAPRASDLWLAPPREIIRRLIHKQGLLDGPAGWAFCLLSGLYEFVLADSHRRLWRKEHASQA